MTEGLLVSVGGDVFEMRCVVCGETFMMSVGDRLTALIRNNGTETAYLHDACKDTPGSKRWLDTGKAVWE